MNDDDLDRLLTDHGAQWRAEHDRVADVDTKTLVRRTAWTSTSRWAPLAAAAAVVAVLAVVLVIRPGSQPNRTRPVTGPSPSVTRSPTDRTVPLDHTGMAVEFIGDGRLILTKTSEKSGGRSWLEVRTLDRPSVVSFALTTAWRKGGYISCATVNGEWLVYTDVQDELTSYSPGPPQPWKLIAHNLSTGEQRMLDTGMTDMGNEFACAVRQGQRIAWTSGRAVRTTVYDLGSQARNNIAVEGYPLTFLGPDVVVAKKGLGRHSSVVRVNPVTASSRTIASFDGGEVKAAAGHLLWYENTSSDGGAGELHECDLSSCPSADTARTGVDHVDGPDPVTTVSDAYIAWISGGPVNVTRLNGGSRAVITVDGDVFAIRADGPLVAFVAQQDVATPQEKDVLHLVQVS